MQDPEWQAAGSRKARRHGDLPPPGSSAAARNAIKRRLARRCFRSLGHDQQVTSCRDPIRCLRCNGVVHFSKHCPSRRQSISANLSSRLVFLAGSIHSRLTFPELTHSSRSSNNTKINLPPPLPLEQTHNSPLPPPAPAEMERVPGQAAYRPALGRVAIIPSATMAAEANRLLVHAVIITVQPGGKFPSTLEVGYALAVQL